MVASSTHLSPTIMWSQALSGRPTVRFSPLVLLRCSVFAIRLVGRTPSTSPTAVQFYRFLGQTMERPSQGLAETALSFSVRLLTVRCPTPTSRQLWTKTIRSTWQTVCTRWMKIWISVSVSSICPFNSAIWLFAPQPRLTFIMCWRRIGPHPLFSTSRTQSTLLSKVKSTSPWLTLHKTLTSTTTMANWFQVQNIRDYESNFSTNVMYHLLRM